jgi:hypothetical protein
VNTAASARACVGNSPFVSREAGPLKKLATVVGGVILLVLGLMFSVVVLAAVVVVGLIVWSYLWWKTREIRRAMREAPVDRRGGDIIEGEAVVVDETGTPGRPVLPTQSRDGH